MPHAFTLKNWFGASESSLKTATQGEGPIGNLPLTDEMLRTWSSGDLFGWTQNAGMGWDIQKMMGPQFLLLSTQGGIRGEDGRPIALGYHTGHWEVGLMMQAAAKWLSEKGGVPFAAFVSDPCDGRTQGTVGMFDSLPYRNDAAIVFRRLIRSLPTRRGILGIATCDKGLPAMMLALAGSAQLPSVVVPGGVTLPAKDAEDLGKVQTIGARYANGMISLEEAAEAGCRACGSPGGGCQFLGTAATSQVIAEALGMTVPHAALAPSGQPIWIEMARQSAAVLWDQHERKAKLSDILNEDSFYNAIAVHAACGGSTNLLLHVPAIAFAAGIPRPGLDVWKEVNRRVTRFVDVLPNGPMYHPTVRLFLAGGVPEIMWHLRELGIARCDAKTVTGLTWHEILDQWAGSERRTALREMLRERDGVDADSVIIPPANAKQMGLTSTVCFPQGNICPDGSVIKSTAIDPSVIDADGVYRKTGPARVFTTEKEAVAAAKGQHPRPLKAGDVVVLIGRGPMGTGMEETYQLTSALKFLEYGKHVAVVTDARFSGVSTGACIGHAGPEALAGGPIGKVKDDDVIRIEINRYTLESFVNFIGCDGKEFSPEMGAVVLAGRSPHPDLREDERMPSDSRLWAALQKVSGGTWGGCVYDVDRIIRVLEAGEKATVERMILILDNYDSFVYNLDRYLQRLGQKTLVVRSDAITVDAIGRLELDAIVISPGPKSPDEAGCSMEVVRRMSEYTPILGVCLGHQAIGQAFGGKIVRANAPMHGKSCLIEHDGSELFAGIPKRFQVGRYHSLIIETKTLPKTLKVIASADDGTIMAVKHLEYSLFGVQFHPESILTLLGYQILANFLNLCGLRCSEIPQDDLRR